MKGSDIRKETLSPKVPLDDDQPNFKRPDISNTRTFLPSTAQFSQKKGQRRAYYVRRIVHLCIDASTDCIIDSSPPPPKHLQT